MRVAVIGAGLAGLAAARTLRTQPGVEEVVVFDKGRSVGGRMATRRIGDARLDHGAQFFTVRHDEFRAQVDDWRQRGLVRVWCRGFGNDDGHPRFIGSSGMNSLAKDLATGLAEGTQLHLGSRIFEVARSGGRWHITVDDGARHHADALVATCPISQTWAILAPGGYDGAPERLWRTPYHPVVGLLVVLDRPSAVPEPGGVQFDPTDPEAPFGFVGDNHQKGISPVPAVTFHATQPWSARHVDADDAFLRDELLARARPWLGDASVLEAHVKRWRLATPSVPWPDSCWVDHEARLALAGDVFAGPRVEAAYRSGLAAAHAVTSG